MDKERGPIVIATSFDARGRARAQLIASFLELFELPSVLGETFGGLEVSQGVRERLESASFVVAILSREVQVGEGTWKPSDWIIQEIAWAKARNKELLILLEDGVQFSRALVGEVEFITFHDDSFSDVLVQFGRQLRALLNRHLLTTGIKPLSIYTYVSDEPLSNHCADHEAKLLILKIRHLSKQKRYEEALGLAFKATRDYPACWRGWSSLGALMVQLGNVDEGDKVLAQVLSDFPDDDKALGAALHNRAWVLEIKGGLNPSASARREHMRLYARALKHDPSLVNTRACLYIGRLLLGETDKAEKLLENSLLYEGFLDALSFELAERGASAHKALQMFPSWLRSILFPTRGGRSDGDY